MVISCPVAIASPPCSSSARLASAGGTVTYSVFSDAAWIMSSEDPDANGRSMYKFGAEVTYRFFSWLQTN